MNEHNTEEKKKKSKAQSSYPNTRHHTPLPHVPASTSPRQTAAVNSDTGDTEVITPPHTLTHYIPHLLLWLEEY
ncbi:hypothetical protein E2C01_077859 [Portunus trituberculatus]|uniref:Uncharacterized protein n=1 Tax=Portunus trituberculatus TaxID=210409 RepID=A0A5B7IL90_PORTR|nr:hypothetical protein [Portunus trituberculatus]